MLYLLLAIAGSAMIAVVVRLSQGRVGSISVLSVNYLICMLLSGFAMGFGNIAPAAERVAFTSLSPAPSLDCAYALKYPNIGFL